MFFFYSAAKLLVLHPLGFAADTKKVLSFSCALSLPPIPPPFEQVTAGTGGSASSVADVPAAATKVLAPEIQLAEISDGEGFVAAFEYYRKAKAPRKILQV